MKKTLVFLVALLVVVSYCSQNEDSSSRPKQTPQSSGLQDKPASLENCLTLGGMLEFSMEQAAAGVRTAEMSKHLSNKTRQKGIKIARERLKIVGELLDLFEKDAMNYKHNALVKLRLKSLPEYRKQLDQHSAKLDKLSR